MLPFFCFILFLFLLSFFFSPIFFLVIFSLPSSSSFLSHSFFSSDIWKQTMMLIMSVILHSENFAFWFSSLELSSESFIYGPLPYMWAVSRNVTLAPWCCWNFRSVVRSAGAYTERTSWLSGSHALLERGWNHWTPIPHPAVKIFKNFSKTKACQKGQFWTSAVWANKNCFKAKIGKDFGDQCSLP